MDRTNRPPLSRQQRAWAHASSKRTLISLTAIEIQGSSLFADQQIEVPPVMAVVGRHGSGKTALFRLMESGFGVRESQQSRAFKFREDPYDMDGRVTFTLNVNERVVQRTVDLTSSVAERAAVWADLDPQPWPELVSFSGAHRDFILVNQDYPAFPESLTELHRYTKTDLEAANRILGREFTSITTHLVDQADPYFTGAADGREIDNASMSAGELWFHYLEGYVFRSGWPSLKLIDEPEAGIAQRSHRALIDELVRLSLSDDAQLLVGTHAPAIAAQFPLETVRIAIPTVQGIRYQKAATWGEIDEVLGVRAELRALILVEDSFAAELLATLSDLLDQSWTGSTEVICTDGHGAVRTTYGAISLVKAFTVLPILDGDQRRAPENSGEELFLPGTRAPEVELLDLARSQAAELAALLGRTTDAVERGIYDVQGLPHQRIPAVFARSLRIERAVLLRALVKLWISDDVVREQCEALLSAIAHAVEGTRT